MNSQFELIKSPWVHRFEELVSATQNSFTFTSPFIKMTAVNTIMKCRTHPFSLRGITSFRLRNFERGASDLEAIKTLQKIDNAELRNISNIHAKLYVFDSIAAVISSANLTPAGLGGNVEFGILIKERRLIRELKDYIDELFSDKEKSAAISDEIIDESEKILKAVQPVISIQEKQLHLLEKELFQKEDSTEDMIFQSGAEVILQGLSGWKKDIFSCLFNIENTVFSLQEVYAFEKQLFELHPENVNIQPKIRQQLQELRDMGLLEFTAERGVYRKLWK